MNQLSDEVVGKDRTFRVAFRDGESFILRSIYAVDPKVYGNEGLYSGIVVAPERVDVQRQRLFRSGSGLDFRLDDVLEIRDAESGVVVFPPAVW